MRDDFTNHTELNSYSPAANPVVDETDDQGFQDDALMNFAAENAPKANEDQYPRFGMSFLLPVNLFRQHGNNSFGDFNPKNKDGTNKVNLNFFPAFALMPLFGGRFRVPYENNASESNEPPESAPFDYASFMKQTPNGFESIQRNAKECAELFMRETRASGGWLLESLTGFRVGDQDKGLRAARELVSLVMPVGNQEIFERTVRVKNGVAFKGPFLDEILKFVLKESLQRVMAANISSEARDRAELLHADIRAGLENARAMANTILNESEAEIKDPNGIQKAYTPPNLSVVDAPVSTDLYCLAHTNRIELDDKQLRASENIGKGLSDPMLEVVKQMKASNEMMFQQIQTLQPANQAPAEVPNNLLTLEQVNEMLNKQSKAFAAQLKKMEEKFSVTQEAAPTLPAPPPVIEATPKKGR